MPTKIVEMNGQRYEVTMNPVAEPGLEMEEPEMKKPQQSDSGYYMTLIIGGIITGLIFCKIMGIGAGCPFTAWMF